MQVRECNLDGQAREPGACAHVDNFTIGYHRWGENRCTDERVEEVARLYVLVVSDGRKISSLVCFNEQAVVVFEVC